MFTGLIEHTSKIRSIENTDTLMRLSIENPYQSLKIGDSIAVNGACLTVVEMDQETFSVEVINETKRITALSSLKISDYINLERAMALNDRLDGHLVSGHVDRSGELFQIDTDGEARVIKVKCPQTLMRYMVHKGSVTIDGISLTLFDVDLSNDLIILNIIPETLRKTNLGNRGIGDEVNIEADLVMKHIDHLINYEKAGK